jgi:hypothetical protein
LKEASLLKSSILILKRIHGRSMLYWEFMFELVLVFYTACGDIPTRPWEMPMNCGIAMILAYSLDGQALFFRVCMNTIVFT